MKRSVNKNPVAVDVPKEPQPGAGDNGFKKIFFLVLIVLGVLYIPGLFKNGVSGIQGKPKSFMVKKVVQFSLNPSPEKTFFVTSVSAVGANRLAVTDSPGCQVLLYDFKGKLIRKWGGKSGEGNHEFKEPSGITNDRKGNLYVLDTWNGAVKIFDLEGKLQKVLDLAHFGFFYGPRWIGWGGESLLIPNASNYHLARLSLTGELLSLWHGKDDVGEVASALGDGKGNYYVAGMNDKRGRIQVFDELGKVIRTIKTEPSPTAMALGPGDRIYIQCEGGARVYSTDGKLLGVLTDQDDPERRIGFNGIDIASDGSIVTCGGDNVTIYKISENQ